ncbi:MAG: hypothetical protein AABY07_10030 [Nanoarchaeota archaeon]
MDNKNLMFIVLAILVLGFFSTGLNRYTGGAVVPGLTVEDAYCEWRFDHFETCVTVNWNGLTGDYAKAEISGGESLSESPYQYESPFTYCQNVGSYEGKRATNVFIYDYGGKMKERVQSIKPDVICEKPKRGTGGGVGEIFKDHVSFAAYRTTGRAEGSGEFLISLPKNPVSCEIVGEYRMRRFDPSHAFNKRNLRCMGTGKFQAYVDNSGQGGTDDPDPFYWGDEAYGLIDPPPRNYEGNIVNLYTCDRTYLSDPRYYIKAKVTDFSNNMKVEWEYMDDGAKPTVDVIMDVKCELEKSAEKRQVRTKIEPEVEPEVIEIPPEIAEPFLEEEPVEVVPVKRTFFQRLKEAFGVLFG